MLKSPPLVADSGIIIRFGLTNQINILRDLYSGNIILPTDVITELITNHNLDSIIRNELKQGWIEEFHINYIDHPQICYTYANLKRKFGSGESAVMAIAKENSWTVGSDDMRATKKFCKRYSIPLMGSLGILYDAFKQSIIDANQGQLILSDMINITNYKCPVSNFSDVINWFEYKKGPELF